MQQEIKNLQYFKRKLKTFLTTYLNDNILTIRDKETKENLEKLIEDIDKHLDNLKNDKMYEFKSQFVGIINDLNEEIAFNRSLDKPIKTDYKPFNERAYSKLNYLFRKQKLLSEDVAKDIYENNYDMLFERYEMFLELINWLNDNSLAIIAEKTLFSAYLGISVDTYNDLLKNASNIEVRNLFKNIDEYFTTNQFGALINNDRKSLERIQKTETYGQEMRQTQPDNLIINNKTQLSFSDLMQEIQKKKQNIIDYKG